MNRFPLIMALAGFGLLVLGGGMLLRLMIGPDGVVLLGDDGKHAEAMSLFAVAGRDLFSIYVFAMALGLGMFCAGLATMFALRWRG